MKLLFLIFVSGCWLGSASAGNIGDEYSDKKVPADSDRDCKRLSLERTIYKFEADDNKETALQQSRLKIALNCKEILEKKLTFDLAEIDNQVIERVNLLVENSCNVDGVYIHPGLISHMSGESIAKGILETIKQSGTNLSSIKTVDEVEKLVDNLLKDCKQLYTHLRIFGDVYKLFLDSKFFKPEPIAVQWAKNTELCRYLGNTANRANYATRVYRLMYPVKSEPSKPSEPSAQIKRSKVLDIFTKKNSDRVLAINPIQTMITGQASTSLFPIEVAIPLKICSNVLYESNGAESMFFSDTLCQRDR